MGTDALPTEFGKEKETLTLLEDTIIASLLLLSLVCH